MKKRQDKAGKSAKCGLNALLRLILISCSAAQQRHTQLEAVQLAMLHVQQSRQVNAVAVATAVLCSALFCSARDEDEVDIVGAATSTSRQDDDDDNGAHHADH